MCGWRHDLSGRTRRCLGAAVAAAAVVACHAEARDPARPEAGTEAQPFPDAPTDTTPDPKAAPCAALDLVFAIDNSGSMSAEQRAMGTEIFPAFARELRALGPLVRDFRVGVKDACAMNAKFHIRGDMGYCMFEGGNRWIESSSERLFEEFACVGQISSGPPYCTDGGEEPASAAAAALEPAFAGPGQWNEGFLREESTLVVVAMTDEDEQPRPDATAKQVYERLVAVRGDVKRIVFLAIGADDPRGCAGPYGTAFPAPKLKEIAALFAAQERGVFWDICAGSFEEGLARAMAVIRSACKCTAC